MEEVVVCKAGEECDDVGTEEGRCKNGGVDGADGTDEAEVDGAEVVGADGVGADGAEVGENTDTSSQDKHIEANSTIQ